MAARVLPKIVAAAFALTIGALAIASWDIARGRVPETTSALINDLLQTPEDRRCSSDVSAVVMRHVAPGANRADALATLRAATVTTPRPWFWKPVTDDQLSEAPGEIRFARIMRYTAFGNHKVVGRVTLADDRVSAVQATMLCPFN